MMWVCCRILNPLYFNASFPAPASWPIQVDEVKKTVTAAAGVPQRILLDSLDQYTSASQPSFFTLSPIPPFPTNNDEAPAQG